MQARFKSQVPFESQKYVCDALNLSYTESGAGTRENLEPKNLIRRRN